MISMAFNTRVARAAAARVAFAARLQRRQQDVFRCPALRDLDAGGVAIMAVAAFLGAVTAVVEGTVIIPTRRNRCLGIDRQFAWSARRFEMAMGARRQWLGFLPLAIH